MHQWSLSAVDGWIGDEGFQATFSDDALGAKPLGCGWEFAIFLAFWGIAFSSIPCIMHWAGGKTGWAASTIATYSKGVLCLSTRILKVSSHIAYLIMNLNFWSSNSPLTQAFPVIPYRFTPRISSMFFTCV